MIENNVEADRIKIAKARIEDIKQRIKKVDDDNVQINTEIQYDKQSIAKL